MYEDERQALVKSNTIGCNNIKDRLLSAKVDLQNKLNEVEEASEILEKNPDFAKLVDILRNIGY